MYLGSPRNTRCITSLSHHSGNGLNVLRIFHVSLLHGLPAYCLIISQFDRHSTTATARRKHFIIVVPCILAPFILVPILLASFNISIWLARIRLVYNIIWLAPMYTRAYHNNTNSWFARLAQPILTSFHLHLAYLHLSHLYQTCDCTTITWIIISCILCLL